MAIRPDNKPLKIGSVQSVEIEAAHSDVVMVCLKRGGKIFRGALINSPPGSCLVGLPNTAALCEKLDKEFPMPNEDPTVVVEPTANQANDEAEKVQHSALSYRQSYFQNMPLPQPKPLLHSSKEFRENRPKSSVSTRTRHIRLRPRQVLCRRCQGKCDQSTSGSVSSKNSSKSVIGDKSRTLLKKHKLVNDIGDKSRILLKKRKLVNDSTSNVPTKKIKKSTTNGNGKSQAILQVQQRSPIIKISYATPQGKGHVMRIPPRSHTNQTVSRKPSTQNVKKHATNGQKNIKKAQKVLKIAKTKAQQKAARSKPNIKVTMFNGYHPNSHKASLDSQHRKIRIIKSKGTYHSTTSQDTPGSTKLTVGNLNNNNTKSAVTNKKPLCKLTVVTTKLPTTKPALQNGSNSKQKKHKNSNLKKTKHEKHDIKKVKIKPIVKIGINPSRPKLNGLAFPPHITMKNSGYDSSSEFSNQSSKSSRSTKRGCSQSSGDDSDNPLVIVESNERAPTSHEQSIKKVPPLNLRIHKKNVTKSSLPDGRVLCIGDVVWGKIVGFPWWPGRINEISMSRKDTGVVLEQEAQITWFGAKTLSYMPVSKLYPFLKYFNSRYDRKKRGVYREAIRLASEAAAAMSSEVRALNTMFETSQLHP